MAKTEINKGDVEVDLDTDDVKSQIIEVSEQKEQPEPKEVNLQKEQIEVKTVEKISTSHIQLQDLQMKKQEIL